ncbi:response regulator transcription factor [Rhodopirellula halodulae]|uniref:response regulator transcription factor n=1 Tax=Rhodopirellula halodulae TaxID=2894198 RepID=UPI001E3EFD29|nr:response regulator transcription factor [Rhodopirellula sp. JC737]MCC9656814.1 response regulator transcription factor [Rhodopirellula sp. JC737]
MTRILIAEDDRHTRAALEELLGAEGYDVETVADGLSASKKIESKKFDLICLDVMMPMKSGFDVCRFLRSSDSQTPVIFITAKGEEIDKVVGFELGADDYISKPFGSHEVIARVKAVLRRCQPEPSQAPNPKDPTTHVTFNMHDLQVTPSKLRATRGDTTIELTARELQILILLHDADGDVVHRQTLFQECWGHHRVPNSRTVDQTVSQLRKRIEIDPKHPRIIQTVYGIGYRCECKAHP